MLKPIPADFGQEVGYNLGGSQIYHKANTDKTTIYTHIHTCGSNQMTQFTSFDCRNLFPCDSNCYLFSFTVRLSVPIFYVICHQTPRLRLLNTSSCKCEEIITYCLMYVFELNPKCFECKVKKQNNNHYFVYYVNCKSPNVQVEHEVRVWNVCVVCKMKCFSGALISKG